MTSQVKKKHFNGPSGVVIYLEHYKEDLSFVVEDVFTVFSKQAPNDLMQSNYHGLVFTNDFSKPWRSWIKGQSIMGAKRFKSSHVAQLQVFMPHSCLRHGKTPALIVEIHIPEPSSLTQMIW